MKRLITEKLINWENSKDRKPLILRWARQVGKNNYDSVAYFNLDYDDGLAERLLYRKLCC